MSLLKTFCIALTAVALLGTILNGFAKFHDNRLKLKDDEVNIRMQQIQDECDRKIAEHKEEYQRLFQKKVNEMETDMQGRIKELDQKSAEDLTDESQNLLKEKNECRMQLQNVTNLINEYKSKLEQIEKLVQLSNNRDIQKIKEQKT